MPPSASYSALDAMHVVLSDGSGSSSSTSLVPSSASSSSSAYAAMPDAGAAFSHRLLSLPPSPLPFPAATALPARAVSSCSSSLSSSQFGIALNPLNLSFSSSQCEQIQADPMSPVLSSPHPKPPPPPYADVAVQSTEEMARKVRNNKKNNQLSQQQYNVLVSRIDENKKIQHNQLMVELFEAFNDEEKSMVSGLERIRDADDY